LASDFDLILGNDFLTSHKAVLSYHTSTCTLVQDGKPITLRPLSYSSPHSRLQQPTVPMAASAKVPVEKLLLNAKQSKRAVRHGCDSFLVMVNTALATGLTDSVTPQASQPFCGASASHSTTASDSASASALSGQLDSLRAEFADVFAEPSGLPPDRGIEHVIPLEPDAQPPFKRMYRLSPSEVKRQVIELLQKQLIEPSVSPYGAPILFVLKKGGALRMVIDYRALNKLTVKNRYPLPRIDDLFDQLQGSQYLTSLETASGFHQILLQEFDRPKTAFRTPYGHYQFRVLPFGLTNAPATFQAVMNKIFDHPKLLANGEINPLSALSDYVLVFIDDILIFSKTAEEHAQHVKSVLTVLRQQRILIKESKCTWGQTELPYLGHIVSKDGIKIDPKKVQAVADWPQPTNLNEIQQFLGLVNFFRKYIQGYTNLCMPLTALLRKNTAFLWTAACQDVFAGIKTALTTAPCLALPDTSENATMFELVCDASVFGLGAVLIQEGRPIAFWSRKMVPAERNYHVTEQELLAVIDALKAFRCYVDGVPFTLVTDHKPNTFLTTQPTLSRRQTRWSEHLQRFNFTWEYRPGRTNVADPLSRNPSYRPAAVLHALRAKLNMTSRRQTALQTSETPAVTPTPIVTPILTPIPVVTSPFTFPAFPTPASLPLAESSSFATPPAVTNPSELAADTVIPADMANEVAAQPMLDLKLELQRGYQTDAWFLNELNLQDLTLLDGLWWKGDRLVVPCVPRVRSALLWEYHDSPYAGHLGVNKTLRNLQRSYWWQGMFSDCTHHVQTCVSCQRNKRTSTKPAGLLQPLHIPVGPWDSVSTDYVTGLPRTPAGHDAILVFVDKADKVCAHCTNDNHCHCK